MELLKDVFPCLMSPFSLFIPVLQNLPSSNPENLISGMTLTFRKVCSKLILTRPTMEQAGKKLKLKKLSAT
jgi:hypothetical protein